MKGFDFSTLAEVMEFLDHRKRWWLLPILAVLSAVGAFVVVSEGSAVLPMIYALF